VNFTPPFPALLRELCTIPALSGEEDAMSRFLADQLAGRADAVEIDSIGNVIARLGPPGQPSIAILAHMDSIGMRVNRVNRDGTLGAVPVGGVNFRALPGAPVRVGDLHGVVTVRSQHQAKDSEAALTWESLAIDVGGASVEMTTPVLYAAQAVEMPGECFAAPYLDDRAGCAVLLHLAGQLPAGLPYTVYLIGTVQEETNSLGAYHALQAVRPAAALFVDGTVSHDTPETASRGQVKLGAGPVLLAYLYTRGGNGWSANPKLRAHLKQVAGAANIPYQQDAVDGLIADSKTTILLGIPSAVVGLPMRSKHAPLEVVHLRDLVWTVDLLASVVAAPLPSLARG
jgi:endoglucanase